MLVAEFAADALDRFGADAEFLKLVEQGLVAWFAEPFDQRLGDDFADAFHVA
ncbi:hypothetical protein D3C83_261120 [compost metagenome]